uniref:(northern house mosquito) hypothetical protein n=1 Tax=Culex pipiens TaxID=7175 RepID=A0A8D7ZTW8_CULPI
MPLELGYLSSLPHEPGMVAADLYERGFPRFQPTPAFHSSQSVSDVSRSTFPPVLSRPIMLDSCLSAPVSADDPPEGPADGLPEGPALSSVTKFTASLLWFLSLKHFRLM